MGGEAQARTCPLPGPREPELAGSKGRSQRPGRSPGDTDLSHGRPLRRPPRSPAGWAAGSRAAAYLGGEGQSHGPDRAAGVGDLAAGG